RPLLGLGGSLAGASPSAIGPRGAVPVVGQHHHDTGSNRELGILGSGRLALPRERRHPRLALLGGPRLVLEKSEQVALAVVCVHGQRRPHETQPTHAIPATRYL